MSNLKERIGKNFKRAGRSFSRFPAAIISAVIVSVATIVKIAMDFESGSSHYFLLSSIQAAFLLAASSSMAFEVFRQAVASKGKRSFGLGNLPGIVIGIISFLLLYFFGRISNETSSLYLSNISLARVAVGIFISIVAFIYIISKSKFVVSFSNSFFIAHRAFVISAIYGMVLMLGVSGVLGAFQSLVYTGMSFKIYQYLGVIVGFLTYTIFLGYFPKFQKQNKDTIKKLAIQPKFIFILFEYILIPIMIALTFVLLVWATRVVLEGVKVSFNQLSGIASSYIIVGIWLHIMVGSHKTKLSRFYKRAYPFTGVLILIFEAWALWDRISKFGLKSAEYSFLMIWILAAISILFLIFLKDKAHRKIALTAIGVSLITVLPMIGYQDITFNSQVSKLEKVLEEEELLVDGKIVSKKEKVEATRRGIITDAVDFISSSEKTNTPSWFKEDLDHEKIFKVTFGFEKSYGVYDDPEEYNFVNYRIEEGIVDISDYSISLNTLAYGDVNLVNEFQGKEGYYEVIVTNEFEKIPEIEIRLEGMQIYQKSMEEYLSKLLEKYPPEESREIELGLEDMSLTIETDNLNLLMVINNIDVFLGETNEETNYYIEFNGIYAQEK